MRSTVVVTLLILGLAELASCSTASAQAEQRRIDSLLVILRPRQAVRLRLSDGTERKSTVARIDSNPVRISLRDGLSDINATTVDTLHARVGTYAKPVGIGTAGVFAVALGAVSYVGVCTSKDCHGSPGPTATAVGAIIGAGVGGIVGAVIGKMIPRWRLKFARAPEQQMPIPK